MTLSAQRNLRVRVYVERLGLDRCSGDGDVGAGSEGLLGPAPKAPAPLLTATPVVASLVLERKF